MPTQGGRQTVSKRAWIKRLTVLAFAITALSIAFDRLGWTTGILAQEGKQKKQATRLVENPDITRGDCDFLKSPKDFTGVQARHRTAVSTTTEAVADRLTGEGKRLVPANEIPRRNIIDNTLFDRMSADGVLSAPLTGDEEFARRAYLDLTGHIPSPGEVVDFLNDGDANKRDKLVEKLINSPEFVDKWTQFYGDLFQNTAFATNINRYIGGREAFYKFIHDSIAQNKSYAQIATEMITAKGDSFVDGATNFIVGGNVPMGPAQDTYDGLAVNTATTFLGLSSMDCLLCHDGAGHLDAVNLWGANTTRAQAWGMAAFFARTRRAQTQLSAMPQYFKYTITEAATGEYTLNTTSGNRQTRAPINGRNTVDPRYPFGNGGVNQGEERRTALARHITADPQFARAAVNYLWEELMVEALVSPSNTFDLARLDPNASMPDGWTLQPANAHLLEALTQEFIASGYNIRHIIGLIAKSSAYQLSAQYPGEWKVDYVPYYARKFARRLDAEEIIDAIIKATGVKPVTSFRETGQTANTTILGFPILNDAGMKVREVQWAMQLPEPAEPRQNGAVAVFLNSFLRGNRDSNLRSDSSSILQALNMMNNSFVTSRIKNARQAANNNQQSTVNILLSDTSLSNEYIITHLFLNTLSRHPRPEEVVKLLPYFNSMGKQAAAESIQWVLLNKVDFIFNY